MLKNNKLIYARDVSRASYATEYSYMVKKRINQWEDFQLENYIVTTNYVMWTHPSKTNQQK